MILKRLLILPAACYASYIFSEICITPILVSIVESDTSDMDVFIAMILINASLYVGSIFGYVLTATLVPRYGLKSYGVAAVLLNIVASAIVLMGRNDVRILTVARFIGGLSTSSLLAQIWLQFISSSHTESVIAQSIFNIIYYVAYILGVLCSGIASMFSSTNAWEVTSGVSLVILFSILGMTVLFHDPMRINKANLRKLIRLPRAVKNMRLPSTIFIKTVLDDSTGPVFYSSYTVLTLAICEIVTGFSEGLFYTILSIALKSSFNYSDILIATTFILIAVASCISNVILVPHISSKYVPHVSVLLTILFTILAIIISNGSSIPICIVFTIVKIIEQVVFTQVRVVEQGFFNGRYTYLAGFMSLFQIGAICGVIVGVHSPVISLYVVGISYLVNSIMFHQYLNYGPL